MALPPIRTFQRLRLLLLAWWRRLAAVRWGAMDSMLHRLPFAAACSCAACLLVCSSSCGSGPIGREPLHPGGARLTSLCIETAANLRPSRPPAPCSCYRHAAAAGGRAPPLHSKHHLPVCPLLPQWLMGESSALRRAAAQSLGLLAEVEGKRFGVRLWARSTEAPARGGRRAVLPASCRLHVGLGAAARVLSRTACHLLM